MDTVKLTGEKPQARIVNQVQENAEVTKVKDGKEDFGNFVTNNFQNSMLTRIPQVTRPENWTKKVARTLVFIFCIVGFIYQFYSFMKMNWEYDVVMDVQVTNPYFTGEIAATVCYKSGMKAIEACKDPEFAPILKKHRLYCWNLDTELTMKDVNNSTCGCNPHICDPFENVLNLTFVEPAIRVENVSTNELKKWMINETEFQSYCYHQNNAAENARFCNKEYTASIPCKGPNEFREACFTFNSLYGRPNDNRTEVSARSEIFFGIVSYDDLINEEYLYNQISISFHEPRAVVNPLTDGIILKPKMNHIIRLKKVVKQLLPAPYKTDCMDYLAMWKERGGKGPTNMKECIAECERNVSLALYGCVISGVYGVGFEKRCDGYPKDLSAKLQVCGSDICKPACYEEYYETSMSRAESSRILGCDAQALRHRPVAYVHVKYDGMETTQYTYNPKYQEIATFGCVGGYIGLLLGVALIVVFDFLDTLFVVLKYPLKRYKSFNSKRKTQDSDTYSYDN